MQVFKLINSEAALQKLNQYGYLPARSVFFLSKAVNDIQGTFDSYHTARNMLLKKYGTSEDGVQFVVPAGDAAIEYRKELLELNSQETDISFPSEKITLCVEFIEKTDRNLPPEKRLGFSANDWLAIQEVIKVVETEG